MALQLLTASLNGIIHLLKVRFLDAYINDKAVGVGGGTPGICGAFDYSE